jgi:hypothetical protein
MHFERRTSVCRGISGDCCARDCIYSSKYAILEIHRTRCFARLLCEPQFKVSAALNICLCVWHEKHTLSKFNSVENPPRVYQDKIILRAFYLNSRDFASCFEWSNFEAKKL